MFVLGQVLEDLSPSVSGINIITPSEQRVLDKFNATSGEIDRAPLCKLFEKQVEKHLIILL